MKKLLLIAFLSISFQLVSQAQDEMKFVNTNLVEYNGEKIKIKEAKKMTKEAHPIAFKQFRRAQFCRGFAIASDVVWLATTNDPKFEKFKRGNICRVSIAEEISTAYHSRITTN